jgi:hypothetical protein
MPEISRFYGLIIKMFFKDHAPPHIHVVYGEYNAVYDISALEMTEGDLPHKGQLLVKEWLSVYQNDLLDIWNTQQFRKLPPLT